MSKLYCRLHPRGQASGYSPQTADKEKLLKELQTLLNFDYVTELWVVGSAVDDHSTFTENSDIDIICFSEVITGEVDEFMEPTDKEAQKLLKNPEQVWGHATEGVELEYTLPVETDDGSYDATIHLIAQPTEYDITKVSGSEVKLYP